VPFIGNLVSLTAAGLDVYNAYNVYQDCRAGNKIKGRERHILTDTDGNLVHAAVHAADIQDRDGAPLVLAEIVRRFPWLRHVFADGDYAGDKLRNARAGSASGPSKSSSDPTSPRVS
jgi:putative transposase